MEIIIKKCTRVKGTKKNKGFVETEQGIKGTSSKE
jgi:hypothetical protein